MTFLKFSEITKSSWTQQSYLAVLLTVLFNKNISNLVNIGVYPTKCCYNWYSPYGWTRAGRPLRNNSNFTLIKTNKEYFDSSFFPETIRLWNNLNDRLKSVTSYEAFTEKLNTPTFEIPKHYYSGSRKTNVILARLRMCCSELNDDLYKIGVTHSPACSCGARKENSFHYFMTCPNYAIIRQQLHAELIKLTKYSIGTILYGDKTKSEQVNTDIVILVHNFIVESNRFQ